MSDVGRPWDDPTDPKPAVTRDGEGRWTHEFKAWLWRSAKRRAAWMSDRTDWPCDRCGKDHDEPLCDDEMAAVMAMQLRTAAFATGGIVQGKPFVLREGDCIMPLRPR